MNDDKIEGYRLAMADVRRIIQAENKNVCKKFSESEDDCKKIELIEASIALDRAFIAVCKKEDEFLKNISVFDF